MSLSSSLDTDSLDLSKKSRPSATPAKAGSLGGRKVTNTITPQFLKIAGVTLGLAVLLTVGALLASYGKFPFYNSVGLTIGLKVAAGIYGSFWILAVTSRGTRVAIDKCSSSKPGGTKPTGYTPRSPQKKESSSIVLTSDEEESFDGEVSTMD